MNISTYYAIWFSQRNGSTLLCKALEETQVLGKPGEHLTLHDGESLLEKYHTSEYAEVQEIILKTGATDNGVFGVKLNAPKKDNDPLFTALRQLPRASKISGLDTHFKVWDAIFPNCKHLFITRRNKVRQAVSWWKAIVTNEWHRKQGDPSNTQMDRLSDKYDFNAIKHLFLEISLRESKIQAFLDEGGCSALTIVYEDFIHDYTGTIQKIGQYLGQDMQNIPIAQPYFKKLADDISDEWTERFRIDVQKDWDNIIW